MLNVLLFGFIRFYRVTFSHFLGGNCRYYPSCSVYAEEALKNWPWHKAVFLIGKRLLSCHPLSRKSYFDPVPANTNYIDKKVSY